MGSARITAETLFVRGRGWLRTLIRLVGVGLVLLGAWNMLLAPLLSQPVIAPYREWGMLIGQRGGYFVGDVVIMGVGAVVAWFV